MDQNEREVNGESAGGGLCSADPDYDEMTVEVTGVLQIDVQRLEWHDPAAEGDLGPITGQIASIKYPEDSEPTASLISHLSTRQTCVSWTPPPESRSKGSNGG